MTRVKMVSKVGAILLRHMQEHTEQIYTRKRLVCEVSLVFKEQNFIESRRSYEIDQLSGSGLGVFGIPIFVYQTREHNDHKALFKLPKHQKICQFTFDVMQAMRLSNETCLLGLIFIERLISYGNVQLLAVNWRPIIYACILIATKYWEDI